MLLARGAGWEGIESWVKQDRLGLIFPFIKGSACQTQKFGFCLGEWGNPEKFNQGGDTI